MTDIDGNALSMATDFGAIGFGTLEPGNGTLEEQICFTGLTNNANGTVTLTGVSNVSFVYPYTKTSGLLKTHAGSSTFVISNTSGFYDELTSKADDETITGTWTFTAPNFPTMDAATPLPTLQPQLATKAYVDSVVTGGAANATTSVQGLVQLATRAQYDAGTLIGSTSASLVVTPDILKSYLVDTGSPNVIIITPSPALASYVAGQQFSIKTLYANTSPTVSINANGLGAKWVVRNSNTSPVIGDITASGMMIVEYDGTNFRMLSQLPTTIAPTGTPSQGDILYYNGTAWTRLAAGTSPYVLTTNGAGQNPSWTAPSSLKVLLDSNITAGGGAFTTSSFTASSYLRVVVLLQGTASSNGGLIVQFNGDTGSNYASRNAIDGGTQNTATSAASINTGNVVAGGSKQITVFDVMNYSGVPKLISGYSTGATAKTSASDQATFSGIWDNSAAQITTITLSFGGNINFTSGDRIIVYGN